MSTVNLALQILPSGKSKEEAYHLVDKAIEVIQKSGLKYIVCPFETVIEGEYETVMKVVEAAQQACYDAGATDLLVYIKLQRSVAHTVRIEDKIGKYRS
jgi:uncharacterized protein YqgV (UPF0045/DUF77 family)